MDTRGSLGRCLEGPRTIERTGAAAAWIAALALLLVGLGCEGTMGGVVDLPVDDQQSDLEDDTPDRPRSDEVGLDPDGPGDQPTAPEDVEDCINNVDDDGNEFTDCYDPACACEPEACSDNVDNDGDGLVDCLDPECDCVAEDCVDGVDDDGDGLVDCLDPECDCEPEVCDDNVDNDIDGQVDCMDTDCVCEPEVCYDGVDNDGDGLIDCGWTASGAVTPDPECDCFEEGCTGSERIAFLVCDNDLSGSVNPGTYSVDTFRCPDVVAAPELLNGYDTIAYYGGTDSYGVYTLLSLLYTAGAKIIVFANPDMSYLSFGDMGTHYHDLPVSTATVTVTSPNSMTDAFVADEQGDMLMVQFQTDSPDWCGDLYFQTNDGVFNGHFHGFRRDVGVFRGLVIYHGLYTRMSDVVDFTDPFVIANLNVQWNPGGGLSADCGLSVCTPAGHGMGKPVIYLYPEETQRVRVQLDFEGQLVTTYPEFDSEVGGWDVVASPDGTMTNLADGEEYSYIYWNGVTSSFVPNFDSGFVVAGEDTVEFLQSKLAEIGLLPYEYNEMIMYWLPYMQHHRYNLIHFAGEEYTDIAQMTIRPEPDSLLRVFMVFEELSVPISVPEQTFQPFERDGFTVVEWGGSEIGGDWHVVR